MYRNNLSLNIFFVDCNLVPAMNVSPSRPRKTKVKLEHELNEVYRLLLDGTSAQEIKGAET